MTVSGLTEQAHLVIQDRDISCGRKHYVLCPFICTDIRLILLNATFLECQEEISEKNGPSIHLDLEEAIIF